MDARTITAEDLARYLLYAVAVLYLLDALGRFFREGLSVGLRALAVWGVSGVVAVAAYAHRGEIVSMVAGVRDVAVLPRSPATPGLAVVRRGDDGTWTTTGFASGTGVPFTIDTGATSVTLTDRDAARLGIDPSSLDFDVDVATANGATTVARVVIPELRVGDVSEHDVDALVARPGQLSKSLLGMSFLGRLAEFRVAGDVVELRGGPHRAVVPE